MSGNQSKGDYAANSMVQDALERRIIVIAGGLNRLGHKGVIMPSGDQIINRRNTIAHQYDEYSPRKIWLSLWYEIPDLKEECDRLLEE